MNCAPSQSEKGALSSTSSCAGWPDSSRDSHEHPSAGEPTRRSGLEQLLRFGPLQARRSADRCSVEPRIAQRRVHPVGTGEGEGSTRPRHFAQAEDRRGLGEPGRKGGALSAGAPADERQPAAAPQRLAQVAECRPGSSKNITPKLLSTTSKTRPRTGAAGRRRPRTWHERRQQQRRAGAPRPRGSGKVRAQSMPTPGGARRQDGRLTAAAPDVENVLPVLDRRGGQQPRPRPAQHPLMPLTLLDELPPAGSVPVRGLHLAVRPAYSPDRRSCLVRCVRPGCKVDGMPPDCASPFCGCPPARLSQRQPVTTSAQPAARGARFDGG